MGCWNKSRKCSHPNALHWVWEYQLSELSTFVKSWFKENCAGQIRRGRVARGFRPGEPDPFFSFFDPVLSIASLSTAIQIQMQMQNKFQAPNAKHKYKYKCKTKSRLTTPIQIQVQRQKNSGSQRQRQKAFAGPRHLPSPPTGWNIWHYQNIALHLLGGKRQLHTDI